MSVTLTDNAAEYIKSFAGEARLRVNVTPDACAGLVYQTTMITRILDNDYVYTSKDVQVVVAQSTIPFVDGTEIDYNKLTNSFEFNNPNSKASCGCNCGCNK